MDQHHTCVWRKTKTIVFRHKPTPPHKIAPRPQIRHLLNTLYKYNRHLQLFVVCGCNYTVLIVVREQLASHVSVFVYRQLVAHIFSEQWLSTANYYTGVAHVLGKVVVHRQPVAQVFQKVLARRQVREALG